MLLLAVTILVLVVDQASKAYIRYLIPDGSSYPLIPGILHITHVRNPGAAFGLLPNQHFVFLFVSIGVIIFILYYYWRVKSVSRSLAIAFSLVLGGAIGNLIDRVASGRVTDFIDLRVWPVFNVADSAIVVGVILISLMMIGSRGQSPGFGE